jgi:hypothetical protein
VILKAMIVLAKVMQVKMRVMVRLVVEELVEQQSMTVLVTTSTFQDNHYHNVQQHHILQDNALLLLQIKMRQMNARLPRLLQKVRIGDGKGLLDC